jgi:hypothetical protein
MSSFNQKTIFDKFLLENGYKIPDEKLDDIFDNKNYYDAVKGLKIGKSLLPSLTKVNRDEIIKNKTEEIRKKLSSPIIQHDDVTQIVKDLIAHAAIFKGTLSLLLQGGSIEEIELQNAILKDLKDAGIMSIIDKFFPEKE